MFSTVILDYGHGGMIGGVYQTPGGKQYHHTDVSPPLSLHEGVSNRQTAARIIPMLLRAGVRVEDCVAQRSWSHVPASWMALEQADVSLSKRVGYINGVVGVLGAESCLVLSLHSNAVGNAIQGPSQSARGAEVYTTRGQDASDRVATDIYKAMAAHLPLLGMPVRRGDRSDGDPDNESNFYVLRKSNAIAEVLTETGFFTNYRDALFLSSARGQDAIAHAIFTGIRPHLAARAA